MRLTRQEISAIKESFSDIFGDGKILLFGSRTDEKKKGGDIDLFINPDDKTDLYDKKIKFLVEVQKKIGIQKIDIVFHENEDRPIEREALKSGVKL